MNNRKYRNIEKYNQKQENISKMVHEMKKTRFLRLQDI